MSGPPGPDALLIQQLVDTQAAALLAAGTAHDRVQARVHATRLVRAAARRRIAAGTSLPPRTPNPATPQPETRRPLT